MQNVVIEFGKIRSGVAKNSVPGDCCISATAFNHLKTLVIEETGSSDEIDKIFRYSKKAGVEYISAKNYVGIIETKDGTTIEILPKIYFSQQPDNSIIIEQTRKLFLNMLSHLKDSPFRNIENAHIKAKKFPVLEIFISEFVNEFEFLLKKGIKQSYQIKEENLSFFKSRLLFNQNIRINLVNRARFYVEYDEFQLDNPQNRLIKSTLNYLKSKSISVKNKTCISNYLTILDEIPESSNFESDFQKTQNNRLFSHYSRILDWARVFLMGNSFTTFKGKNINRAILFPMEKIFESYVSSGLRKYIPGYSVFTQDSKYHLIDKHNGQGRFKLIPDNVLRNDDAIIIIDTKWKLLDEGRIKKNYLIESKDIYQMYAYAEKYITKECFTKQDCPKSIKLLLLYPSHENFKSPLDMFVFHEGRIPLKLFVLPFRLDCTLKESIEGICSFV